jgi:hypothetical protein
MGRNGNRQGRKPSNAHVVHRRGGPGAQQGCPQVMVRTNFDGPAGHSSEGAGGQHLIRGQASFTTDQCLGGVLAPPRSAVSGSRGTRRGSARRVESRRARRRGPRSASPVSPPWPRAHRASCASIRVRESASLSRSLSVGEFIESPPIRSPRCDPHAARRTPTSMTSGRCHPGVGADRHSSVRRPSEAGIRRTSTDQPQRSEMSPAVIPTSMGCEPDGRVPGSRGGRPRERGLRRLRPG